MEDASVVALTIGSLPHEELGEALKDLVDASNRIDALIAAARSLSE